MTFEDETEVPRTSVGAKVLVFACAILAVLGSFWTIVWFIRSYVEAPRVSIPAPIAVARESAPVVPPTKTVAPAPIGTKSTSTLSPPAAPIPQVAAPQIVTTPPAIPSAAPPPPASPVQASARRNPAEPATNGKTMRDETPAPAGAVADRWVSVAPAAPVAPPPAPAPAPQVESAPAALAMPPPDREPTTEEVEESAVPAISGTAPLPRRKPSLASAAKRNGEPPLPRPRPDGSVQESVWTPVTPNDDRFPQQ